MGRRRKISEREEEDEDEFDDKRKKGSVYIELSASESDDGEQDGDYDDEEDEGFFVDTVDDIPEPDTHRVPRSPLVCRRDEDEVDVETMEKLVNDRYKYSAGYDHDGEDDFEDEFRESKQQPVLPSFKDPKLWLVKCLPGHEREVAASLMQKSLDKGSNSHVFSAIALDHLKNYIYVEAHTVASAIQACKGIRNVFARNITMVPMKEMGNVLSVEHKEVHLYRGDWVRLKRTSYKGELAKVVDVDDLKQKVTVKVIPKLGALSLSDDMERTDYFNTIALSSVSTRDIYPSIEEVENLKEIGEADADMASLFKGKDKGCWRRGDVVVVVKGELQNLKGSIVYVEGHIVHIRPTNEKIPLKTVAVHKNNLAKYFEPGCHVKVVCGRHEGATGMVVKVDRNKLVIVSDALNDHITVFSERVIESKEISESNSKEEISNNIQDRYKNSVGSQRFPQFVSCCDLQPGSRPSPPLGKRTGHTGKRPDSFIGCKVKILNGPYRGYRGCVKGVNGKNVRVELEAQMKTIIVDRSHISDKLAVSNASWAGGETPMNPRTPLHPMEGETPWQTPFRSPGPSTPILHGSSASTFEHWDLSSLTSPSRFVPTP